MEAGSVDLFEAAGGGVRNARAAGRPLADRMRPARLADVIGQSHLLGPDGILTRLLTRAGGLLPSLILWGPPGTGKTSIARLLAGDRLHFAAVSAVFSGVAELRRVFDEARARRRGGMGTLLFVDEIHRFNRAQQDAFLPVLEDGTVVLVGATTENPSFALNGALLSRCQVLVLHRLDGPALAELLARAEAAGGRRLPLTEDAQVALRAMADGDGRAALNMAEQLLALPADTPAMDAEALARLVSRRAPLYDRDREEHYNLISALHKAVRGSDPDAALYWFARMVAGGEDPRFIARRLVRAASEDIGLADPGALGRTLAAWDAYERLGSPEGELALAAAVLDLAAAPKSNAAYLAWGEASAAARDTGSLMPPAHSLNAPTRLMKTLGYGRGYTYDHATADGFSGQSYFPDGMERRVFYRPTERGAEAEMTGRLARLKAARQERTG